MTLSEYKAKVLQTVSQDWTVNSCWGAGAGPSYLERYSWTAGTLDHDELHVESHSEVASLKTDLSISIAWGFPCVEDFKEKWANQFPDQSASSRFVDFFYNGVMIFRDLYVSVDGGRCALPLPNLDVDPKSVEIKRLWVPEAKWRFFRLLDSLRGVSEYDRYFKGAGIEIDQDKTWMD
jgi:hypothetical protein